MRFHDEVVEARDLDVTIPRKGPSRQEAKMAAQRTIDAITSPLPYGSCPGAARRDCA